VRNGQSQTTDSHVHIPSESSHSTGGYSDRVRNILGPTMPGGTMRESRKDKHIEFEKIDRIADKLCLFARRCGFWTPAYRNMAML
jgi:hypothetical protein